LQTRLSEYEWELREALSKYTELNPKVIKLNERIASLKQMISATNDESIPENTYSLNGKRREMELRLQLLVDDIKLREAQAAALEQTMGSMGAKVAMLSDWEKDYLILQSRLDGILSLETELARRVDETRLIIQRNDSSFDIVEPAATPTQAMPTGRKLMAVAGLVIALGSGLMLVLLLELRDPMVRSKRDVTDIVGVDTCAEIPAGLTCSVAALDFSQPNGQLANLYRSLSNDLDVTIGVGSHKPLAVVSTGAGAGRSTVAANLAATRLIKGQKVLLVDADLRHQSGTRPGELLNLAPIKAGIYEHLVEGQVLAPLHDEASEMHYIAAKAGNLADEQGLLALGATDLSKFLKPFWGGRYTIVDLPPLDGLEVTLELAGQLDNVLLVVRSGTTRRDDLKRTVAQFNKRGINCVATIVLDVPDERLESAKLFSFPQLGGSYKFWRKATFA
jgi:Mrp family chromosome partitioning ATPase